MHAQELQMLSNIWIEINENAILSVLSLKDSFTYLVRFASEKHCLNFTWTYVRSLKSPLPLERFRALFWVPPPPLRAYVLFEWPPI